VLIPRALWSDKFLYLAYEAPYTELTTKESPDAKERLGLWDTDVVGRDPRYLGRHEKLNLQPVNG